MADPGASLYTGCTLPLPTTPYAHGTALRHGAATGLCATESRAMSHLLGPTLVDSLNVSTP